MNKKLLAANWKMKGSFELCQAYAERFATIANQIQGKIDVLACPPSPYLGKLTQALAELPAGLVQTGIQNVSHICEQGAFTGEIHPLVLRELGCSHAIIGHSERRRFLDEDNHIIGQKMLNCFKHNITPVLCVGESTEERERGDSEKVIKEQLSEAFANCQEFRSPQWPEVSIAYEPFWAIGSGQAAGPEIITEIHSFIRQYCVDSLELKPGNFRILYGGSLNRNNVAEISALKEVDGGLIGGASLDAEHFGELAISFAK